MHAPQLVSNALREQIELAEAEREAEATRETHESQILEQIRSNPLGVAELQADTGLSEQDTKTKGGVIKPSVAARIRLDELDHQRAYVELLFVDVTHFHTLEIYRRYFHLEGEHFRRYITSCVNLVDRERGELVLLWAWTGLLDERWLESQVE